MATQVQQRAAHPFHMYDAIQGQPQAVKRALDEEAGPVRELAEKLAPAERMHLVGIGTSWHASLVVEHLLRKVAGRDDARA